MESELFIGVGCLVMVLLGMIIALFTLIQKRNIHILEKNQQMAVFKESTEAAEMQKARIARILHDQVLTQLTVIEMNIDFHTAENNIEGFDKTPYHIAVQELKNINTEIRHIAHNLSPKSLRDYGLTEALRMHVNKLNAVQGSAAGFYNETEDTANFGFSPEDQLTIYLICLEILNNAAKHAGYSYIGVRMETEPGQLVLTFSHDGVHISNEEIARLRRSKESFGLRSMQSRLLILNATLDYTSDTVANIKLRIPAAI